MIIARAPARISFGGGTDLAAYYERFGGLVLSTAISSYCTVTVRPTRDRSIRLCSETVGLSRRWDAGVRPTVDGEHQLGAAAIERFYDMGLGDSGADVVITSDVPHGSGLGSSSTVTVALVTALSAFVGYPLRASDAAEIACDIEINGLGMPIGRQDQFASAFGGLNVIEFERHRTRVTPLDIAISTQEELDARLLLFYTGRTRRAADILRQQQTDTSNGGTVLQGLHNIKALTTEMIAALQQGNLDAFGDLLHRSWLLKKSLSTRISSGDIDYWYEAARDAGALGGKITGAGGGGCLLVYCQDGSQHQVRARLTAAGLSELPFTFDRTGAQVLPTRVAALADLAGVSQAS